MENSPLAIYSAFGPQPATKTAKARVEEEKGARPFDPVATAATEGWRTCPWPFTPRAEQVIFFEGPVAKEKSNLCYTFGMANDEDPVEKALMASSSVTVTSEDSSNSNLEPLPGEVGEPLSGGASTPSRGRALSETARPLPPPVPATARRGGLCVTTGFVGPTSSRRGADGYGYPYRGVRPNKNNNDDGNNISNKNHATLAERFQPSTLHKLRQPSLFTNTDTPERQQHQQQ